LVVSISSVSGFPKIILFILSTTLPFSPDFHNLPIINTSICIVFRKGEYIIIVSIRKNLDFIVSTNQAVIAIVLLMTCPVFTTFQYVFSFFFQKIFAIGILAYNIDLASRSGH
jgi:hypothetical protein